ncbi:Crp/Fnr family transcriptional regulator [Chitinophaga pollutisoli]|uniref:Crp/Fnr family transcriptional regulator n=1 Tax=Chitinophaga pollutisoli TaxID=3133966 RepID=A0ABZ2YR66_9BACT
MDFQLLRHFLDNLTPLSPATWDNVRPLFRARTLEKGDYFIWEGQHAREIGFLVEGVIRAFYRNVQGQEYNKHFFTPPCFIGGYASIITGQPNLIQQEALTDCRLLVAPADDFQQLLYTCGDLERMARILAERFFVAKEQREIEIVQLAAEERYRLFRERFPALEASIPQYHIASYLGITPTQLSRIRRKSAGR